MVLFLVKKNATGKDVAGATTWAPAISRGGMTESVAWIERKKVYAISSFVSGVCNLHCRGSSERELRRQVDAILQAKATMQMALRQSDASKVTAAIAPLLRSESSYVTNRVIENLGEAGPKALPALRIVFRDDSLLDNREELVLTAMAKAGGVSVGPELTEVIQQELAFWKQVGPNLKKDWWNGEGIEWKQVGWLRFHYSKVYHTLGALERIQFGGCSKPVIEFRDFWRSLPQLGGELDQLDKKCDEVIAALIARAFL